MRNAQIVCPSEGNEYDTGYTQSIESFRVFHRECATTTGHLHNGGESWNRQPVVVEHRKPSGIVRLEKQLEADWVYVVRAPKGVSLDGSARLQQIIAADADHVGVICPWGQQPVSVLFSFHPKNRNNAYFGGPYGDASVRGSFERVEVREC